MARPLLPGILVSSLGGSINLDDLLYLNSGCDLVRHSSRSLFVPRDDWRKPTSDELNLLVAPRMQRPERLIGVLRFEPRFVADIRTRLLAQPTPPEGRLVETSSRDDIDVTTVEIMDQAAKAHGLMRPSKGNAALIINRPNLTSTTFDVAGGHSVGLHLDSHRALPIADGDASLRLLSLNLGSAVRYLHFVNLDSRTIAELLGSTRSQSDDRFVDNNAGALLSTFADYPVTRLVIPPGTAYLCDTEAVIHDGATNTVGKIDAVFQLLAPWPSGRAQ